eukprot:c12582_g1_i1.p1 GENE.c12582_g1_i1~~c12582_g1_i1.p1  ORF type:complete len:289 (+),score=48.23 c12582_g1_i1:49-915(+)
MRVFLLAVLFGVALSQTRIPKTVDGHHYGLFGSQIHLEMFLDLACDDCRNAWPVIRGLFDHYPSGTLEITTHHLPLPFHRNAFSAAVVADLVAQEAPDRLWDFMDSVYSQQSLISNDVTKNLTETQIPAVFAQLTAPFGIGAAAVTQALTSGSTAGLSARSSFKYSLQRGALGGTPSYAINGVIVQAVDVQTWTLEQWIQTLDSLLEDSSNANSKVSETDMVQLGCASGSDCEHLLHKALPAPVVASLPVEEKGCSESADIEAPCPRVKKSSNMAPVLASLTPDTMNK